MKLDPTKMKDWQIAEAAEETMKPISQLAKELGLKDDEVLPMGRQLGRVDYVKVLERLKSQTKPSAKYIDVTAITPTPLGEGKSTTTIGLIEGLGKFPGKPDRPLSSVECQLGITQTPQCMSIPGEAVYQIIRALRRLQIHDMLVIPHGDNLFK